MRIKSFYPIQRRLPTVLILKFFKENGQNNIIVINEYKGKSKNIWDTTLMNVLKEYCVNENSHLFVKINLANTVTL